MSTEARGLPSSRLGALARRAAPARAPARDAPGPRERCELCGVPVPEEHRHVVDLDSRELLCACRACALLFDRDAAGGDHYRLVPDRCVQLDESPLDDLAWRSLGLPVGIAFVMRSGHTGRATAFYPSPAGPTESELELETWADIEERSPEVAAMRPDVEALLVNRIGEAREAYVVGVDECYRLVGLVRAHWRGLGGGDEVWRRLEAFFGGLRARAQGGR